MHQSLQALLLGEIALIVRLGPFEHENQTWIKVYIRVFSGVIEPGKTLVIRTDARKWKLRGGWLPGRYKAWVRVDGLTIDRYSQLSVTSDPFEFEIKAAVTREEK